MVWGSVKFALRLQPDLLPRDVFDRKPYVLGVSYEIKLAVMSINRLGFVAEM
jgi:hypothetical protein